MDLFDIAAKITLDSSGYEDGLKAADSKGGGLAEKLSKGFSTAAKVTGAALGAAATGISALIGNSIKEYADYEQLVGGVETLFKQSADVVIEYANNAYKTAGLSANEYMETVTSFSASLLQSLGGDTKAAVEYADMAITDMSDNANKMGSSMDSIQAAYQGFAKQNYTMLDNLKLGYGGTKEEMIRLVEDAQRIDETFKANTETVVKNKKKVEELAPTYADIVQAIHIVQTEMGITGTTALEASETISGSVASMKSAWQNLVTGISDENANLENLIDNFVESVSTAAENIIPRISPALQGVGTLIKELAPVIADALPGLITDVLPVLLESAGSLITSFGGALMENLPLIVDSAMNIIMTLVDGLAEPGALEGFVNSAFTIISKIADSIGQALPELIPAAVSMVIQIVESLLDNIDLLIDAAIQLIIGLATGLIEAIPILLEKAPEIIVKLVQAIIRNAPKLLQAAATLISTIGQGIANAWEIVKGWGKDVISKISEGISSLWADVVSWGSDIINNIADGLTNGISSITDIGKNIISGIWEGISGAAGWLWDKISGWATGLLNGIKGLFGIASPSKVFRDQIGKWLPLGLEEGFEDEMPKVEKDLQNSLDEMAGKLNANISYSNGKNISNRMHEYDLPPERPIYLVLDSGELVGKIVQKMDVALGNENTMKLRFGGATV